MELLESCQVIKFAPNQKLPEGYKVIYNYETEYYHWVNEKLDACSTIICCRWLARRAAINHYKEVSNAGS
jgi:hypothetical protein